MLQKGNIFVLFRHQNSFFSAEIHNIFPGQDVNSAACTGWALAEAENQLIALPFVNIKSILFSNL